MIDEWVVITHKGEIVAECPWFQGAILIGAAPVPPRVAQILSRKLRAELATITARAAADFIEELRREAASGAKSGAAVQVYLNAKLIEFGIPLLSKCQGAAHEPGGSLGHDGKGPDYCSICGRDGRWGFIGEKIRVRK